MVIVKNFNEFLERDLDRLAANIKERQLPTNENQALTRETLKESLKNFANQSSAEPVVNHNQSRVEEETTTSVLPDYLKHKESSQNTAEVRKKIQYLIQLAFQEGLAKAIKEAKNYPPFIEDAFHDALIDKLMPELKKRGLC